MSRKPALKREALTEIDLGEIVAGTWSSNPFCLLSVGPCVTFLCSKMDDVCLAPTT